ncbi:hypothetical protein JCM10449v2_001187 [Rhodotorula kratochvilovae]
MLRLALPTLRAAAPTSRRSFASSVARTDLKSTADGLNRAAGETLKAGIEATETVAEAVKKTAQKVTGNASQEAKKVGADAQGVAEKTATDLKTGAKKVEAELNKQ